MSVDVDTTQWSLPGPADAPRDDLKVQLEVYGETILLRGFEATPPGSGPSRRTRSPTCSPSTWGSPRGCCRRRPSGGTRARPGRWWPCGGRRRCGRWPCNGRRSSLPPGSGFPCRAWSSSARRAGRPGPTPPWTGQPTPSSSSSASPPSTSSATGGSAPEATGSPRRWG